MAEVRKVIDWFGDPGLTFDVSEDLVGGAAYDAHGTPLHRRDHGQGPGGGRGAAGRRGRAEIRRARFR
jgi:hypothetical protein